MNLLVLIGGFGAYLVNQWLLKSTGISFFHSQFNDVLAGLLLLAWSNLVAAPAPAIARWVASPRGAALLIGGASLVWEGVAPQLVAGARFDPLDVLAYFAGGALYLCLAALPRGAGGRADRPQRKNPALRHARAILSRHV